MKIRLPVTLLTCLLSSSIFLAQVETIAQPTPIAAEVNASFASWQPVISSKGKFNVAMP